MHKSYISVCIIFNFIYLNNFKKKKTLTGQFEFQQKTVFCHVSVPLCTCEQVVDI